MSALLLALALAVAPVPVTPGATVYDDCGTENDRIDTVETEGLSYTLTSGDDLTVLVTATGDEAHLVVPDLEAGWNYAPHANAAQIVFYLTDTPCEEAPTPEETAAPPVEDVEFPIEAPEEADTSATPDELAATGPTEDRLGWTALGVMTVVLGGALLLESTLRRRKDTK